MPTKILAIDDSKTMRLAIKITFAAEDAKVTAVSKGSEAVARAKQLQADVVLVDHALAPGEPSGFEVVQALKANPATAKIPVIMLVPARGGVTEADIMAAGADNYIGKPFDTQELIDKVAAALGRGAKPVVPKPKPAVAVPAMVNPRPTATTEPKPPVTTPGPKPPVATTVPKPAPTVGPKPPVAVGPKPPAATGPKPPAATQVAAPATANKGVRTPAATATPAAAPVRAPVATTPAATASTKPSAVRTVAAAPATGGPSSIPIAVPIPFTAASSPTPGMLARLEAAAGQNGAVAGLDPAAIKALLALSHEIVEQVVWEVVPDLAEELIKQKVR